MSSRNEFGGCGCTLDSSWCGEHLAWEQYGALEDELESIKKKNFTAAKLIWALLEDREGKRTPEAQEVTGTVKQALEEAKKKFFEE
jgi:hypothetical protein